MEVRTGKGFPGRDICREVRRRKRSLGRGLFQGASDQVHCCAALLMVRARVCYAPTTYAAFLCLPNALLIGLPPGPVKAISIIEQL